MENPVVNSNPSEGNTKNLTVRKGILASSREFEFISHQFSTATFFKPTFCEHCGDMIWEMGIGKVIFKNKFGVRCKVCNTVVHKQCEPKVVNSCIGVGAANDRQHRDSNADETSGLSPKFSEKLTDFNNNLENEGSHKFYCRTFQITEGKYCNFCRDAMHLGEGVTCELCSFTLHKRCFKKLTPQSIPRSCKKWFFYKEELEKLEQPHVTLHEWIEGNVDSTCNCLVCKKNFAARTELTGFRCSWCHSALHNECSNSTDIQCSLGSLRSLIVPPIYVIRDSDQIQILPLPEEITPLLVFINRKSGGQQGATLFRKFKRLLNPVQVFDLGQGGPGKGLELFRDIKNCKALVCGGDGTVGWYLMSIDRLELPNSPPCAILPLGTGNDLARSLNWGGGYEGEELLPILENIVTSKENELDRWSVSIGAKNSDTNAFEDLKQVFVMNNYFSIGVDAKVSLEFHQQREAHPERFKSRIGNKISYGAIGGKAMFEHTALHKVIEIEIDGQQVQLPHDAEGLVVINLDSYMGGTNIWGTRQEEKYKPQSINDGLFEVLVVNGSFHLGAIKAHLASSTRIAQCKDIKIYVLSPLASQVDGEPWMQPPAIIHISHLNTGKMLVKK